MTQTNAAAARHPRITVIDAGESETAKLRVAAYARVSSDSADQLNSYMAQVDFYTKFISSREDWNLVDIYADEGLSGLEFRKREEFNRMIADCQAGKIDRVLVKSTSRFAWNTTDYIRAEGRWQQYPEHCPGAAPGTARTGVAYQSKNQRHRQGNRPSV